MQRLDEDCAHATWCNDSSSSLGSNEYMDALQNILLNTRGMLMMGSMVCKEPSCDRVCKNTHACGKVRIQARYVMLPQLEICRSLNIYTRSDLATYKFVKM